MSANYNFGYSSFNYSFFVIKRLWNILLGGEGLFLTKLVGPGKVILQSQNFGDFAGKIISMMPNRNYIYKNTRLK